MLLWCAGIGFHASATYAGNANPSIAIDHLSYARLFLDHWQEIVVVEAVLKETPKSEDTSDEESGGGANQQNKEKFIKPYLRELRFDKHVMGMRDTAMGTGFVCGKEGKKTLICTNAHIIEGGIEITVRTASDKEYRAVVLVEDAQRDRAVLAIESEEKLSPVVWGNPDMTANSEVVMTIGHPKHFWYSSSHGILSGKRLLELAEGKPPLPFLQLDIALNFGNSGSPVFNMKGEVVGVAALILGKSQGIAFAIPINDFRNMVEKVQARQTPAP